MIDFSKVKKEHYYFSHYILDKEIKECFKCRSEVWPCEILTIIEEFELFIKKMKFNIEIANSWVNDYNIEENILNEVNEIAENINLSTDNKENIEKIDSICIQCKHLVSLHDKFGCNYDHNEDGWIYKGCICSVQSFII